MGDKFNNEPVVVKLAYNQTHIAGLGDIVETAVPLFDQFDLNTILMQLHKDLTTRKLLLVGHSQGAVYANKMYEYLSAHGVPKEDMAVYAVATPDTYVAGGGKYLTYTLDGVISGTKTAHFTPLPPNVDFVDLLDSPDTDEADPVVGHSFIAMYLGGFGTRIVSDMREEMSGLTATAGTAKDGCFDPPENTLGYKATGVTFAVADPVAGKVGAGLQVAGKAVVAAKDGAVAVAGAVGSGLSYAGSAVGSFFGSLVPKPRTENLPGSHDVVKAIYGSSVTEEDLNDLLGTGQGGAVVTAFAQAKKQTPAPVVEPPPAPPPQPAPKKEDGEVKGVEVEKPPVPQEPLIPAPPPSGGAGSPGFGGGGDPPLPPVELPPPPPEPEPPPVVVVPPEVTLAVGFGTSTLGQTKESQPFFDYPIQRLGSGLTGTIGSVAYKVHGTDVANQLASDTGLVRIYDCYAVDYSPIGYCQIVSRSTALQIAAQTGDDAVVLASMSAFVFEPLHLYMLQFYLGGDMAMYGSTNDSYGGLSEMGHWGEGGAASTSYFDTNGILDWGFRICDSATCAF
ncbi:hypothetical protein EXS62_02505 [Candidatus Kaiserbacteria bacterium]|nr:hypothetical protein [Candidatus Kaiserbacteria bacterium]